jgi:hypothetical protein
VKTVAHHQPMTIHVDLAGVRVDVGGHLGLQRCRQHLPSTVADNLIEQRRSRSRRAARVGLGPLVNYREYGRTFPNQRANAGPDQSCVA